MAQLGNHRSSVFRRHVGIAIMNAYPDEAVKTWGRGDNAPAADRLGERDLERRVSRHLGEMTVLWLPAAKREDRDYFERNIIGLLTGGGLDADPPSAGWLGRFSPAQEIAESGLWNIEHVGGPTDLDLLKRLKQAIDLT
jgi:hypothetical protein